MEHFLVSWFRAHISSVLQLVNNLKELLKEAEIIAEIEFQVISQLVHLLTLNSKIVMEVLDLFLPVGVCGLDPTDLHVLNSGKVCFTEPFHDFAFLAGHLVSF